MHTQRTCHETFRARDLLKQNPFSDSESLKAFCKRKTLTATLSLASAKAVCSPPRLHSCFAYRPFAAQVFGHPLGGLRWRLIAAGGLISQGGLFPAAPLHHHRPNPTHTPKEIIYSGLGGPQNEGEWGHAGVVQDPRHEEAPRTRASWGLARPQEAPNKGSFVLSLESSGSAQSSGLYSPIAQHSQCCVAWGGCSWPWPVSMTNDTC